MVDEDLVQHCEDATPVNMYGKKRNNASRHPVRNTNAAGTVLSRGGRDLLAELSRQCFQARVWQISQVKLLVASDTIIVAKKMPLGESRTRAKRDARHRRHNLRLITLLFPNLKELTRRQQLSTLWGNGDQRPASLLYRMAGRRMSGL